VPNRLADWLQRQPDGRRGLYTFFTAVTLLTLPCYLTAGIVLLTSGPRRATQDRSRGAVVVTATPAAEGVPTATTTREGGPGDAEAPPASPTRIERGAPLPRNSATPPPTQAPSVVPTATTPPDPTSTTPATAPSLPTAPSTPTPEPVAPTATFVPDLVTAPPAATGASGAATLPPMVPIVPPGP
jgi:hypothetical protein